MSWFLNLALGQYPEGVEYRERDHRYEGIKSQPASGYLIELISVIATPIDYPQSTPTNLNLKFYLNELRSVYITARERDVRHNYWLDRVTPWRPWQIGFENEFVWPTKDVVARLNPPVKMENLAVVARLEKATPGQNESVAPVILYDSKVPQFVKGYRFSFAMNVDARLSCSIFKEKESSPLIVENFPRAVAGRPFTFIWNSDAATEGNYRLVVRGKKRSNNEDIDLYVHFYHQPRVT
jgi:hypothetical protein